MSDRGESKTRVFIAHVGRPRLRENIFLFLQSVLNVGVTLPSLDILFLLSGTGVALFYVFKMSIKLFLITPLSWLISQSFFVSGVGV